MMHPDCNRALRAGHAASQSPRLVSISLLLLCVLGSSAIAQDKPAPKQGDDLDVTMQIITDPDAKLPDEVVSRIALPARKPPTSAPTDAAKKDKDKGPGLTPEDKNAGREAGERASERAHDAAEQREQARRAEAEERRRNRDRPNPPPRPPRN